MAIDKKQPDSSEQKSANAVTVRVAAGVNVLFAIILATGLVIAIQWGSFRFNKTYDLTSSRINSLSPATETLLNTLEEDVTITSMYYTTDPELGDQKKFRETISDLIELYRIENPSRISIRYINPLTDHPEKKEFFLDLAEIPKFKEQSALYKTAIDEYKKTFANDLRKILENQKQQVEQLSQKYASGYDATLLGAILQYDRELLRMISDIDKTTLQVEGTGVPNWKLVTTPLKDLYASVANVPDSLSKPAMEEMLARMGLVLSDLSPEVSSFIEEMDKPFIDVVKIAKGELDKVKALPELQIETLVAGDPTLSNMIFIQTKEDARSLTFSDVWTNPRGDGQRDKFDDLLFQGEQRISAALLRVTNENRPAVVFTRFGGKPLFFGPEARFGQMLMRLNDLNFTVHDWNLARDLEPPEMALKADRILYVILNPSPPKPSPIPGNEPQRFSLEHKKALIKAIEDQSHSLFIAGWSPLPGSADIQPAAFEYSDYLQEQWGILVDSQTLLLETVATRPGEFQFQKPFPWNMTELQMTDDPIVKEVGNQRTVLPWSVPLKKAREIPSDVTIREMVTVPRKDTVWGVRSIGVYQKQNAEKGFITRDALDVLGPFTLGFAATRGEGDSEKKVVVISSTDFADDRIALTGGLEMVGNSYVQVNASPGNQTLFFNILLWLSDQDDRMNMGRPMESHVIQIERGRELATIRTFVYAVWPGLALLCGLVVWWVRRR